MHDVGLLDGDLVVVEKNWPAGPAPTCPGNSVKVLHWALEASAALTCYGSNTTRCCTHSSVLLLFKPLQRLLHDFGWNVVE